MGELSMDREGAVGVDWAIVNRAARSCCEALPQAFRMWRKRTSLAKTLGTGKTVLFVRFRAGGNSERMKELVGKDA